MAELDWNDARYFLAVARAGQLLAAATRLGINQATLGRHIDAIENALGVTLFLRRTTGCTLTDEGQALLPGIERIEQEFLQIQASFAGHSAVVTGIVRMAVPDVFGTTFLVQMLTEFAERYPTINLQLVPLTRSFSLSQREADLAVMVGQPEKGRLIGRKLIDYTLGLYASPSYLKKAGEPKELSDLKRHRLIGYVEDLISTPSLNFSREIYRDWSSVLELASAVSQLEAVRAGAGIGALHDFAAVNDVHLKPVLPDVRLKRAYWIAWHPSLGDIPRVRAVIEFVLDIVKQNQFVYSNA